MFMYVLVKGVSSRAWFGATHRCRLLQNLRLVPEPLVPEPMADSKHCQRKKPSAAVLPPKNRRAKHAILSVQCVYIYIYIYTYVQIHVYIHIYIFIEREIERERERDRDTHLYLYVYLYP